LIVVRHSCAKLGSAVELANAGDGGGLDEFMKRDIGKAPDVTRGGAAHDDGSAPEEG
jgi:hypothetical protein